MCEAVLCVCAILLIASGDAPKKYQFRQVGEQTECWFGESDTRPDTRILLPRSSGANETDLPIDLLVKLERKNEERIARFSSQYPNLDVNPNRCTVTIKIYRIRLTQEGTEVEVGNELRLSLESGATVRTRIKREVYRVSNKSLRLIDHEPYGCVIL